MGGNLVTIVRNFSIQTVTFRAGDADVLGECVTPGRRRLLRFDFLSHNAGNRDLHIGPPPPPPPPLPPRNSIFTWSQSHRHYHIKDFNQYHLLNTDSQAVAPGFKQTFCLMDIEQMDPQARPGKYSCRDQGVTAGWADVYEPSLPCQYIIIDGVPDGDYRLVATTNYRGVAPEDRYNDNSVLAGVRIRGNTATSIPLVWSSWQSLGGTVTSAPTTAAWGRTAWTCSRWARAVICCTAGGTALDGAVGNRLAAS